MNLQQKPAISSRRSLQLEKRKDKSFLTNEHQKIDITKGKS
jgi:hypothetical protein